MTNYFNGVDSRPAIKSDHKFTNEGAKIELLNDYYERQRKHLITRDVQDLMNEMFIEWTELLFSGFNIAITGPLSKFALLETYSKEYLESGEIPNLRGETRDEPRKSRSRKKKQTEDNGALDIHTVSLHGMEPLKMGTFEHKMFGIKEQKRSDNKDCQRFINDATSNNTHYVFIIHSFELFQRDSGDVLDVILKLYEMNQDMIHIILGSDCFNGIKKVNAIKFRARLLFFTAPFTESFFMEKSQLASALDLHDKGAGVSHRLFEECVDLQSLKDVYQALGPTKEIMSYIIENFVQKSELNVDNQVEQEQTLPIFGDDHQAKRPRKTRGAKSQRVKPMETDLDFHDLLRYCESALFIRRGAALEQHLGELRDHKIIADDDSNNKVQCIVNLNTCKRFLEYVKSLD